jgi:uroporphyrinogen decarboxylase
MNSGVHAAALSKCARDLPVDGVYINLNLASGQAVRLSEDIYRIDEAVNLVIPQDDVLSIYQRDIVSLDDERIVTAELFHPGILETFKAMDEEVKSDYAVAVGVTGTFSQVAFLYGISELMMALLDQPRQVHKVLDHRHEIVVRQVREICESGARFVWIGEGLGSGSLISPAHYREYVLQYEIDLAEEIRKAGALSILHICGDVTAALPDIACCKADGFDLDYPVKLKTALELLLPEIAVKGNINPTLFLKGQREPLGNSCRRALEIAGQLDGFILSTGCLVPRDASVDSFDIVSELCTQHTLTKKRR